MPSQISYQVQSVDVCLPPPSATSRTGNDKGVKKNHPLTQQAITRFETSCPSHSTLYYESSAGHRTRSMEASEAFCCHVPLYVCTAVDVQGSMTTCLQETSDGSCGSSSRIQSMKRCLVSQAFFLAAEPRFQVAIEWSYANFWVLKIATCCGLLPTTASHTAR